MKLPEKAQPELVASKDDTRPLFTHVYLDVDKKEVYATDSYMAVRMPAEVEKGDTSGPIPREAVKTYRKLKGFTKAMACRKKLVTVKDNDQTVEFYRPAVQSLPYDLDKIWPEWAEVGYAASSVARFGINARMLFELAKSMGTDVVELVAYSPLRPIIVNPRHNGIIDAQGLIMPIRVGSGDVPVPMWLHEDKAEGEESIRIVVRDGTVAEVYTRSRLEIQVVDEDLGDQEMTLVSSPVDEGH